MNLALDVPLRVVDDLVDLFVVQLAIGAKRIAAEVQASGDSLTDRCVKRGQFVVVDHAVLESPGLAGP